VTKLPNWPEQSAGNHQSGKIASTAATRLSGRRSTEHQIISSGQQLHPINSEFAQNSQCSQNCTLWDTTQPSLMTRTEPHTE
ncbi:uncharacterized protein METZ01_LOCUS377606, partial [marine metagenome]